MLSAREEELKEDNSLTALQKMAYFQRCSSVLGPLIQMKCDPCDTASGALNIMNKREINLFSVENHRLLLTLYFSWVLKSSIYLEETYLGDNNKDVGSRFSIPVDIERAAMVHLIIS